jgi:hypothetical protein
MYVDRNGQKAWNELMKEFKKYNEGMVWKPVAAKLVSLLPVSVGTFAFRLYKNLMVRSSIVHRYGDL